MAVVLSFTGALCRSEDDSIVNLETLGPSIVVDRDNAMTIQDLGTSAAIVVPISPMAKLTHLTIVSSAPVLVTLTKPGPVALASFQTQELVLNNCDLAGVTITNPSSTNAVKRIRVIMGGPTT